MPSLISTPQFDTWDRATLNKFAYDANAKMKEQADIIEQLRQDNKDLTKANRELLTKDHQ